MLEYLNTKVLYILRGVKNLIFPPICIICQNEYFKRNVPICEKCLNKLSYLPQDILLKKSVAKHLDELSITFVFDKHYQKIVHHLKYKEYRSLGYLIGQMIAKKNSISKINLKNCIIIPIPLHPIKYRERGFNQADLLAKGFSDEMGVALNKKVLKRVKNTQSQTKLSKQERKENMAGAFKARGIDDNFNSVILIDDVYTTGATMDAAAKSLKSVGVKKVAGIASAAPRS